MGRCFFKAMAVVRGRWGVLPEFHLEVILQPYLDWGFGVVIKSAQGEVGGLEIL